MTQIDTFERRFSAAAIRSLTPEVWDLFVKTINTRLKGVEEKKADFEEAEKTLLDLGLSRINETIQPAAEQIYRAAQLGFLVASSDTEVTLEEGKEALFVVPEGDQRDLFVPTPFLAITRRSTYQDYAIARRIAYDKETGQLLVEILSVKGNAGPHSDWDIGALAGHVIAMHDALEATQALRDGVAEDRLAVAADRQAVANDKADAQNAKAAAEIAKAGAQSALLSFATVYRGPLDEEPNDALEGHFYFDTALQQVRVRTASGWLSLAEFYTKTESDERYIQPDSDGKIPKDKLPSLARRVGEFFWYFGEDPPPYALVCDGSTISRTAYADLWAFAQASGNLAASEGVKEKGQFGPGNGTTTFTLPDLTTGAEFIRAVTIGRDIGTWQNGALQSHTHTLPGKVMLGEQSSSGLNSGVAGGSAYTRVGMVSDSTPGAPNVGSTGGTETRPRNIALLPCIVF